MAIKFQFVGKAPVDRRRRAGVNLIALFSELPPEQFVLLDWIGAEIDIQDSQGSNPWAMVRPGGFTLDLDNLAAFIYRAQRRVSPMQRRAREALKRETLAVLDLHYNFSSRAPWREAASAELRDPAVRALAGLTAEYDSSESATGISGLWTDVAVAGRRFTGALAHHLQGQPHERSRLLVEIMLRRDNQRRLLQKPEQVEVTLQEEFPRTYPLVRDFEAVINRAALKLAFRAFPEMEDSPEKALLALRAQVDLQWPSDTPFDTRGLIR